MTEKSEMPDGVVYMSVTYDLHKEQNKADTFEVTIRYAGEDSVTSNGLSKKEAIDNAVKAAATLRNLLKSKKEAEAANRKTKK